ILIVTFPSVRFSTSSLKYSAASNHGCGADTTVAKRRSNFSPAFASPLFSPFDAFSLLHAAITPKTITKIKAKTCFFTKPSPIQYYSYEITTNYYIINTTNLQGIIDKFHYFMKKWNYLSILSL